VGAVFAAFSLRLIPLPGTWEPARLLILDGLTMVGIWLVCVSFLIHARYVIHLSAEPVPIRRWSFRLRRPHWLKLGRGAKKPDTPAPADGEGSPKSSRGKTPRRGKSEPASGESPSVRETASESADARETSRAEIPVNAPSPPKKPVLRFDTSPVAVPAPAAPSSSASRGDDATLAPDVPAAAAQRASSQPTDNRTAVAARGPVVEERTAEERPRFDRPEPAAAQFDDDDSGDDAVDDGADGDSDEFRGLSKKQRRKLLAQQRDRDRRDRRK